MKWGLPFILFFSLQSHAYRGSLCSSVFESTSQRYDEKTFVTQENFNVYYNEYANDHANKTIVLLHGLGQSADSMDALAQQFVSQYRVITVDMIGHGRSFNDISDETKVIPYQNNVENLRQFLDSKNLGQFLIMGHSYGGGIAFELTKVLKQKPEQVVLMAPYTQRLDKSLSDSVHAALIFAPGMADAAMDNMTTPFMHQHYEERFLKQMGKKLSDLTDDERALFEKKIDLTIATVRGVLKLDLLDNSEDLNWNNNIPVFILGGQDDNWVPASQLETFAERFPKSVTQLVFIPNVDHDFPLLHAETTYQTIIKLISRIDKPN